MFKQAALEAKKSGDITQAKEYLRLAKGFDPLIEANQSGIRVDMQTVKSEIRHKSIARISIFSFIDSGPATAYARSIYCL